MKSFAPKRATVFALLLALLLALGMTGILAPRALAAGGESETLGVPGKRGYAAAFDVLDIVNQERANAGLSPLVMDESLLESAMIRAGESAIYYGGPNHLRPDGSECYTVSGLVYGENIAVNYLAAKDVMAAWMNSSGHKANILRESFTRIGVGVFTSDGVNYWVQSFGVASSGTNAARRGDQNTVETVTFVKTLEGKTHTATLSAPESLDAGSTATAVFAISNPNFYDNPTPIKADGLVWKSSNTAVATVSKGVITGKKAGTVTVTATTPAGVYTASARVTVSDVPVRITAQPGSVTAACGETAAFSVKASGTGLTYQWQYSTNNGSTWKNWSGKTASTVTVKASDTNNGVYYRAVVTNSKGSVYSSSAKLTVIPVKPAVTAQPKAVSTQNGRKATFSVAARGGSLSYRWQYSADNGSTWKNWSGKTTASVTVTAGAGNNGLLYRVIVKNAAGSVTSSSAKLTVSGVKPAIRVQPQAASVQNGNKATFTVTAAGTGLTYQWQYSTNNGSTWKNWSGKTVASVTVTGTASNNGVLYRCIVKNSAGSVTSSPAKLTVR